jgi:hypothetical protein
LTTWLGRFDSAFSQADTLLVVVASDEFKRRSRYDQVGLDQLQSASVGVR